MIVVVSAVVVFVLVADGGVLVCLWGFDWLAQALHSVAVGCVHGTIFLATWMQLLLRIAADVARAQW